MPTRTSFSIEENLIRALKNITRDKSQKSLSSLVNKIIKDFVSKYEQEEKSKQLKKNYQQYAKKHNQEDFSKLESALITDVFKDLK